MILSYVRQSLMSSAQLKALLNVRPWLENLSRIGLQNALIGLYLRELAICSQMLIYGIAEIFRQRLFYSKLFGESVSTLLD